MATLSLTLPISCQICLGKVKDPVICSNSHAFCTVCLDMWLQGNSCCPTCRVDITKEKPYRKVLGSSETNEEMNLKNRTQLRKTRLELIGREYENDILNLSNEVNFVNQENKRLKEELDKRPVINVNNPVPDSIEAFSSLTKKLQEISSTYDDVRRDMNQLQEEKDRLQKQNGDLTMDVSRLKEEAKFTKSPKRYEKFTIIGLKAKVDQYEKENEQLRKALNNRDKYLEQLRTELKRIKYGDTEICDQGSQVSDENGESFPNSMIYQYGGASTCKETEVAKISPLEFHPSPSTSTSCSPMFLNQATTESSTPQGEVLTQSTAEQDKELFPATKKLLALKNLHETRTLSCTASSPVHTSDQRSPSLSRSSCAQLQLVNFTHTSNNSTEVSAVHDDGSTPNVASQSSFGTSEVTSCTNQTNVCEISDALYTTSAVNHESQNNDPKNPMDGLHKSPKRNLNETVFMTKRIKIENQ